MKLKVGSRVVINAIGRAQYFCSKAYNSTNPLVLKGTVIDFKGWGLPVTVKWDNGKSNNYREIDLDLVLIKARMEENE